ncbi:MAG: Ig-like domain-containing protein [Burkholderiales bacterium]|nr:Ig-like domain-containing protein [Burkholderiales bacterium]
MKNANRFDSYSRFLSWFMALMLGALLAGCGGGGGGDPVLGISGTPPGTPAAAPVAPTVTATVPVRAITGMPINRAITATFSEAMDPATLTATSFLLREFNSTGAVSAVAGEVSYDATNNIATFTPGTKLAPVSLAPAASYQATITSGARNLAAGTPMAADYTWSFTTALTADTTTPLVIATNAYGTTGTLTGATGLPVNRDSTATFNEAMDPASIAAATFTLTCALPCANPAGAVSYAGNTATFNPTGDLAPGTTYTSTVTTGARDLAGNAMAANYVWDWTTAAVADTAAPTVTITNPAALATGVPVTQSINASFSEEMRQATMITTNFTLSETASPLVKLPGTLAYDVTNNIATFNPDSNLLPDTDYTVTVTNGAQDLAGNALVVPAAGGLPVPNPWTFRTAAALVPPPALAINLRGAATFGIASQAGLTSTGVTVVNGDVALYPLASCTDSTGNNGASQTCLVKIYASTGGTGMAVNGSIYFAGDPFDNGGTANTVTNDLNIAWVEGKNKVDTFAVGFLGGQLGGVGPDGKILLPGVYHEAALGMAAGTVTTFDAQNDANAVFIIKIDSSFVDSGTLLLPTQIKLVNGAQARNIWFVAGLDITIGSGTSWNGNILAGRTATVNDGSSVMGRILAGASGAGTFSIVGAASPSLTTITVP